MEKTSDYLCRYKNYNFLDRLTREEYIDSLQNFEICDADVFLVTYPKSGTIWAQQIITSIYEPEDEDDLHPNNPSRMPWLGHSMGRDFSSEPPPRLFTSHLTPALIPQGLKGKKAKIIYAMRNPKDNLVSNYHFSRSIEEMQTPTNFEDCFERYLVGDVLASLWFDHIHEWLTKREQYNILFLKYEDMIVDLRAAVCRICHFLGSELSDERIDQIVEKSTFDNMKEDPKANYEFLLANGFTEPIMRRGKTGDWKSSFTVAQSESLDRVLQERLGGLDLVFTWDSV